MPTNLHFEQIIPKEQKIGATGNEAFQNDLVHRLTALFSELDCGVVLILCWEFLFEVLLDRVAIDSVEDIAILVGVKYMNNVAFGEFSFHA